MRATGGGEGRAGRRRQAEAARALPIAGLQLPDVSPRRAVAVIAALTLLMLALPLVPGAPAAPCDPPVANPIACENTKPGNPSSEWDVSGAGDSTIQGFTTDISADQGQIVFFKIDTPSVNYRLDIYRMGYYGGNGARKVATVEPSALLPQNQPDCLNDSATGLIDCGNWAVSASWAVPADAVSGIYFARLVREDASGASHVVFVVRDDDGASAVLFQTSDTTWQAYNQYGGNSLYVGSPAGRAYKVSYNRPFSTRGSSREDWVFNAEYPMVRWLERNGYNVSYTTGIDTDRRGGELLEHRVFMSVGHDEYWSAGQRANVEAARAAGVHLSFFSGNEVFWKTRWEPSIDGSSTPHRTLVTYKETHAGAKIDPDPAWTGTWRDPRFSPPADGGRPENALTGTIFTVNCCTYAIQVPAADGKMRLWRNTSVATLPPGGTATLPTGTLGYEWDEELDNGFRPAGLVGMSSTTVDVPEKLQDYGSNYGSGSATHRLTLYRHSSGALVFGAGTVQWSWGLDDNHDRGSEPADARMQQATVNLLADMGVQPATLQSGLVAAAASTDATAPTSTITSPLPGSTVTSGTPVTITGTAADAGGGVVGGVEVSVDGGTTWRRATGRETWSYTWTPGATGSVTIRSRAADDSGNLETPGTGVTVTVVGPGCPCTIWSSSTTPAVLEESDALAVELGVKFRTEVDGVITGIRFYKGTGNTGTHVGKLWSRTGTLLASATFTGETASGWQQVSFSAPVSVTANTTYVASYHAPNGRYSVDSGYFASSGVTNSPLVALQDGVDGPNGLYLYGSGGFPTSTYRSSNYWVDVVFETSATDTTPPAVTNQTPGPGAADVAVGTNVTATFNEPVQPSSIQFELRDPGNVLVPAAVTYDDPSRTATLDPSADLAAATTYAASVRATDLAGNAMGSPVTWSFTTANPPGTCPCTIWSPSTTPSVVQESDTAAVELGVKFRTGVDGYITGIRFYKGTGNTGTHVGKLWSRTGTLLASATFTGETASGWQQVTFSAPVAVIANTTYVASYHAPSGRYSVNTGYFASAAVTNGPLTALQNGTDGGNGIYLYGSGGFPTNTYQSSNYWVDVVFQTSTTDTFPPAVTGQSPAPGASGVAVGSSVTATFNEPVQPSSIQFELRDPGNVLVPAAVTYDDPSRTATLDPSADLAAATTYTASVRATDLAGNAMGSPVTWSFTTANSPGTCPCTIWSPSATPSVVEENDSFGTQVGVKFRTGIAGYITGVRFYKGPGNTGTHVGKLWSRTGTLLASATFTTETASGWQQVTFGAPVAVTANTTYVASYYAPNGRYSIDNGYFAGAAVTNGPLTALQDGSDGPNGVYVYGSSAFPTNTYLASNYWVDVVFDPNATDTTAPQVMGQSPTPGATGVLISTNVTATFNEPIQESSLSFVLRDPAGLPVSASVTYDGPSMTATLDPASDLAMTTTYTVSVTASDPVGNAMAEPVTWSFTTSGPPPTEGPGGPILVIGYAGNPFSRYHAEILRAEGLNEFTAMDISQVTAATLLDYDVVLLGEMPLTTAQVTMLSDWVTAGGNLVAMRPDKKLASLLGLTDALTTRTNGYLLVDISKAPGAGIVGQTIQYHGTADLYSLSGATAVATLHANATTPTLNPAVTLRSVGAAGGQAAAFTFDLARSIVYTRQGNTAWAGQERDGTAPIRSDDMYYGAAPGDTQPDWVDLNKVAIPQADEQQRLLANLIAHVNLDRKPLPRFWYLPRGKKAAVVMTGDDHGNGGTAGRFDGYVAASPQGCVVADWECIRGSSYVYTSTPISDAQAASYASAGFEVGLHVSTSCQNYTMASLQSDYADQLAAWKAKYTSVPAPATNRTHCIAWSDWASQPKVAVANGIRLDTNYYYWPASWVADRPGFFTGSGIPMRFADLDGTMIDVYQAATQLTDESGQSFPATIDTIIDRALGAEQFFGVFTANMHTDVVASSGSDAIVSSAKARGVPVITARQMLEWLDGRNASSFGSISWNATTSALTFTVTQGAGAGGIEAMLPTASRTGTLSGITRGGLPVAYRTETVKGIEYAFFAATGGIYLATYAADTTPPSISDVAAAPTESTATITWTTNEASTSLVDYGTDPGALDQSATDPTMVTSHSVTLTGLSPGRTYYFRVTSADTAGNAATSPPTAQAPASFATAPSALRDTTVAEFNQGSFGTGAMVADSSGGEVVLVPAAGSEFFGSSLPSGWSATAWQTGGAATVANGKMTVDGARAGPTATYGPGRTLEFVATFQAVGNQHAGLGLTLSESPWMIFSTKNGSGLFARTRNGSTNLETQIPGSWFGAAHRFRIEWNASSVVYFVDGAQVASHSTSISTSVRPLASDYSAGGAVLTVDWMRLTPYAAAGSFTSRVHDAGQTANWGSIAWTADLPGGTGVAVYVRTGDTATPDGTWTAFTQVPASGGSVGASSRYVQYRLDLSTAAPAQTPVVRDVSISYGL